MPPCSSRGPTELRSCPACQHPFRKRLSLSSGGCRTTDGDPQRLLIVTAETDLSQVLVTDFEGTVLPLGFGADRHHFHCLLGVLHRYTDEKCPLPLVFQKHGQELACFSRT